ncbi:MAG: hypothetical protein US40_C0009G0032 [Candidatus Roizmanbacteria bacterium GW2011_GWC2_37_13]|uniref:Uncharacterized protein n=1 Tax=Candidatus Roizmanbacteria bacterium GW2011_GWC2_37_13 TaxID=1618486 RepID=A0A0G0JAP9_9BACT|nr:MAG: hypothetical protein US38_C0009G0035 [Candidatus Roizmanbacteria bacterium GW2011_GWC1_37_12]KKQ25326.1 MAG: hypothetical protein US40_C0009G0032 [Candidatus Roizmanbacteria bacterium GW2011_GWC2_37_13]
MTLLYTKFFYENRLKQSERDVNTCQQKLSNSKNEVKNLNDIFFLSQKAKAETTVKKAGLYFSYKTAKFEDNLFKISIYLDGDEEGGADAADLKTNLNNLKVKYLVNGEAFPAYPRKLTENNYILVTGTASLLGSKFIYGQRGLFVELIAEKIDPLRKSEATLDLEGTKIYLNGESILDEEKTFKKILID